jgi:hypothetical protein
MLADICVKFIKVVVFLIITKVAFIAPYIKRHTSTSLTVVSYCDMLHDNASVICRFWIYYYDLLVIHQAELQLIITLSVFHIRPVF